MRDQMDTGSTASPVQPPARLPDWSPASDAGAPVGPLPGSSSLSNLSFGNRNPIVSESSARAENEDIQRQLSLVYVRIDRYFVRLMLLQWAAAIVIALWVSPLTWAGDTSSLHPHFALALLYGGVLTLVPVYLTRVAPGQRVTRLTIAVMQMLMSSLLIHLTGGRIETHFHIFGSLAFLAFYLDWQVLVVASVTIAIDHFLRGIFLPFSIFGVYTVQPWRWLEHTGWVVFCDVFLLLGCRDRLGNIGNLSARHIEREELLRHAFFDSLTGLPNRSFLSEKIHQAMQDFTPPGSQSEGFCCLYIDLDRFKEVNDRMGHIWGDTLLARVAERIKSRLSSDAFLARAGGDKFVVLVPQIAAQPRRAEEVARAILRGLLQPFDLEGTQVTLGASIGISRYPQDGQNEAELLMKSDRAMYSVKRAGRNDVLVHSAETLDRSGERDQAEEHLLRAIEMREFKLHYQPIYHATGSIAGLEALLRWHDPVRGNISPGHFIPLAEETGLIVQLGNFVLHEACKQATDWHSRGLLPGRIAVNVSSLELAREDYAQVVILTLRQHYTPPQCIELEVTETALVNDFALAERHLRVLREYGIRISIDDFGTGYSSLGRLRQLTLDTLKIDRLFVDGLVSSEADSTVVEHIIAMAHTLGMTVVAEGVETELQLQALRALNCDQIQGFLLSKPLDQQTAEALLLQVAIPSESILS
jgi:diguanylate cyclase (GGDEF)-like protein